MSSSATTAQACLATPTFYNPLFINRRTHLSTSQANDGFKQYAVRDPFEISKPITRLPKKSNTNTENRTLNT